MIEYKWVKPEDVAEVVHLACILTPEVSPKMGDLQNTTRNIRRTDVLGIFKDEAPIGAFLFIGREFHAAILPDYRGKWMNRKFIELLMSEREKRGGLYTTLTQSSDKVRQSVLHFCNRYGIEVRHD